MKKFKLFKMLAVLIVLITSISTAWAAKGFKGPWNMQYWYTGNTNTWTANQTAGATINLGVMTHFNLKGCWTQTYSNENWDTEKLKWEYGYNGHSASGNYILYDNKKNQDPGDWTYDNKVDFDVINNAPNKPGQNTMWMRWILDDYATSTTCYVNFTIPGFTTTSTSKSFGTSVPINTESETTISYTHHGNAPTMSDYTITGANAGDFAVRSISNSGVNVIFTPKTTGSKTATLTITDSYGTDYSTIRITLTGTAVANTTTTRLYFNDYQYSGAADWAADGALYRFTCAYTGGVYTHYNMTKCANTEHTYYADVEIKGVNVSIDRYNRSSPYETYNSATPTSPNLSSTNPYAKAQGANAAYATNHPYNDVGNRRFYYDNSASGFTNTLCLLIGRDKRVSDDASNTYSKAYTMSPVTNTKLYYCAETAGTDTWHDVTYYAVIGTSSDASTISDWSSSNNWGSSTISTKGNKGYTAAYTSLFGLIDGNVYLASASSYSGGAMTINKCASTTSSFNSTQTIKYALSTDGGDSYSDMSSGNTPGQISISAYKFVDGTYNSVTNASNTATISSNTSGTYSTSVPAAYTGKTTLSAEARSGYSFDSWDAASTTLYPKAAATYTARFIAHRYTINFDVNDDEYPETTSYGSTTSMTNVVYDQNATLTTNGFHRIGYKFAGWNTAADGSGTPYVDGATAIFNLTTTDGGSETLFAQWEEDENTFEGTEDGDWSNPKNWSAGTVPTNDDAAITISDDVTISGASIHIGELTIADGVSLTIEEDGALEVAGTINSDDVDKIVINSDGSNQGALIFKSEGSKAKATVNMTMNAASGKFQFIALPVSYVSVSEKFPGSTVYTYVWSNSAHKWERRGYYDGISAFEAVLLKGQGSAQFKGDLVSTGDISHAGLTYTAADYGYVYMYGNSWTAPITMSAEICTNASISIMEGSTNGWDAVVNGDVIPALQAFGVAVGSGGGSVSINYDRDVRNPSTPNAPLKAPKRQAADVQPIAIYVSGNEMQTRIRLFEDATRFSDEFDNGWDAFYMEGQGYAGEMYAVGPETKMNVLATSDIEGTVVGFVPGEATDYTISFTGDGKGYYLNDVKMEASTLIEESNTYEFTSDPSTNATRFVISKTPIAKIPTSVDNVSDGVKARKQLIDGALYIIRDGRIYTTTGALVK